MSKQFIQIHPDDNLLVAVQNLSKGTPVHFNEAHFELQNDIDLKHKFTLHALNIGDEVKMYGVLVGKAVEKIPQGGLVTINNVKHAAYTFGGRTKNYVWQAPDVSAWKEKTFMGFHRADGQIGIRNYWLVIPLVFCENRNILTLKEAFLKELGYAPAEIYRHQVRDLVAAYHRNQKPTTISGPATVSRPPLTSSERPFKNVDGIKFLTHESGCGGTREDSNNLCALLAGYAVNPNVAGITVLSLGCQNAQFEILQQKIREKIHAITSKNANNAVDETPVFSKPLYFFERQKWHTEFEMMSAAIHKTFEGLIEINKCERKPAPLSALSVGVKCGGSDGFSGISANPAVGYAADLIAALGGKVLMAEFPELCGVEQELINRCENDKIAENFAYLMREYTARAAAVGASFDMNPSPGNIRDGLITDAMKSAGAAKKGGTSTVVDAIGYGGYATKSGGLSLVCTPGNDVEATTGMAGAGATIQLFTTGLGTATGNPISPIVKIATNNALAKRMPDIIDINSGGIITGEKTLEESGAEILDYIIGLASGNYDTKAMQLDQDDFIFWRRGVSL